jgi:enoyl-CoA hydratase
MDEGATLCMVETRLGLMPDLGGTVRLAALLGRSHALDLICTARDVRSEEALALGLVNRLAPRGRSLELALDLAALVAQNGPDAIRGVKRVVLSMQQRDEHTRRETDEAVACILGGQAVEGVTAWMQKRPPRFK